MDEFKYSNEYRLLMTKVCKLLLIFILLSWSALLLGNFTSQIGKSNIIHENYPKISSYYNLTGTYMETNIYDNGDILTKENEKIIAPILIDDTLENHTWVYMSSTYPWCSGNGTLENPYIIENVYIDGQYMSNTYIHYSNIFIRHSRVPFIIQDCSIHKNGVNERGSIFFYDVTNGIVQDNELTLNGNDIHLFESHNFMIRNNYIECILDQETVGTGKAIWCDGYGNGNGSCNNVIQNNVIINHYDGIVAHFSLNLTITENFLNTTIFGHFPETGLYLVETNYSYITYNTFAGDYADYLEEGQSIISQENCEGNTISDAFIVMGSSSPSSSIIPQQESSWFSLINSNHNYIYGNKIIKTGYRPTVGIDNLLFLIPILAVASSFIILKQKFLRKSYSIH